MTITLPLPARALSPNARVHWSRKARAVKEYRLTAMLAARRRAQPVPLTAATAHVVFYVKDRRRRDHDNLSASLKSAWDGIVDAGILTDDAGLRHAPIRVEVDAERPRVEITITPLEVAA
jgi:crossover junction endodeoxyribonuclease RusA